MKNIFYKCVLEWHFASISGLGGSILSKKSKLLCPCTHIYIDVIQNHCTSDQEDMSSNSQWDKLTRSGKPRSQVFYTGDPHTSACLVTSTTLATHILYCTQYTPRQPPHFFNLHYQYTSNKVLEGALYRSLPRSRQFKPAASSLVNRLTPD